MGELARATAGLTPSPAARAAEAAAARREAEARAQAWAALGPRLAAYVHREGAAAEEEGLAARAYNMLLALAGGTGASIGGTGSLYLDRDLARRMRLQDQVVLLLLLCVYFLTLFVSANLAYRQAVNNSPVTYYADPRHHTASTDGHDLDSFLEAFNQSPKGAYLRVSGFTPTFQDAPGSFFWRGTSYIVDFTFALDLSPWVARDTGSAQRGGGSPGGGDAGAVAAAAAGGGSPIREDGVAVADAVELRRFLQGGGRGNDLATVEMQKEVSWANWEELATNIKQQIRQRGFEGLISIDRTEIERMTIYKNTQWANFMHSKALKVILALSVVGWAVYAPYMWIRCKCLRVRSKHRVTIAIGDYWPLIADHLGASGFDAPEDPALIAPMWLPIEDDSASEAGDAAAAAAAARETESAPAPAPRAA